jgi:hypothetical protein
MHMHATYCSPCLTLGTCHLHLKPLHAGTSSDVVVVDLAPLRVSDLSAAVELCSRLAAAAGARQLTLQERPLDASPFNVLPVGLPTPPQQVR